MAKTTELVEVAVTSLRPYERNAKIHGPEQIEKLKKSIEEFGFVSPCLVDRDLNIIAGHGRVAAAKELGMQTVPCVFVDGLSEEQRRAYIIADNRLTELGEWDMDIVQQELEELRGEGFDFTLTGFTFADITSEDIDFSELDSEAEEIEAGMPEESETKRGDVYILGDHVLICGDSKEERTIDELMRGWETADLLLTDPPYNVALGRKERPFMRKDGLVIENDDFDDPNEFTDFLTETISNATRKLKPGGVFYIWHASSSEREFFEAISRCGLQVRECLIWVKNLFTLGRQDYNWRHEPCLYGWKDGAGHYFIDDRTKSTVFEKAVDIDALSELQAKEMLRKFYRESETFTTTYHFDKPSRSELHPTMKPVALMERQILNSTREGEIVLDIFGGSGSTLIACENVGRRCRMVEYDPHYCDVIVKRWEEHTGRKAVRRNG